MVLEINGRLMNEEEAKKEIARLKREERKSIKESDALREAAWKNLHENFYYIALQVERFLEGSVSHWCQFSSTARQVWDDEDGNRAKLILNLPGQKASAKINYHKSQIPGYILLGVSGEYAFSVPNDESDNNSAYWNVVGQAGDKVVWERLPDYIGKHLFEFPIWEK